MTFQEPRVREFSLPEAEKASWKKEGFPSQMESQFVVLRTSTRLSPALQSSFHCGK